MLDIGAGNANLSALIALVLEVPVVRSTLDIHFAPFLPRSASVNAAIAAPPPRAICTAPLNASC